MFSRGFGDDLRAAPSAMLGRKLGQVGTAQKCYKCGTNEPAMLYTSVGGPNPLCLEVDSALCGVSAGGPLPVGPPIEVPIRVYLPDEMTPLAGAEILLDQIAFDGSISALTRGVTNADGRYVFLGAVAFQAILRITIKSTASTPSFPDEIVTASTGSGMLAQHRNRQIVVCPYGTNTIICEVAKRQALWKQILIGHGAEWGFQSPQHAGLAADIAHNAVLNRLPTDPSLLMYWIDTYSFWVGDLGIPPKDWPKLTERSHQAILVFNSIPWPTWPNVQEYFIRCARGVPITQSRSGANLTAFNPRLFSETFSDYFPRSDKDINSDMAVAYYQGLAPIFLCMLHKFKKKQREVARSMATMSMLSLGAVVAFSPMLVASGPTGLTVLITEIMSFADGGIPTTEGVTMAAAAAQLAVGNPQFIIDAITPAIAGAIQNLDPLAQRAVEAAFPKIIESAFDTVLGPAGIGSGVNTVPAGQVAGSMAIAMMVRMMVGIIKSYGYRRLQEFADVQVGMAMAINDFRALKDGVEVSDHLKPFLEWFIDSIGFEDAVNAAIDEALDRFQEALDQGEAQGGSVAIVEDESGGFEIVPTLPDGVPTDDDGTPLPGGIAPERELDVPSTGPDMVALVGVGGAAALLLAVSGAI